MLRDSDLLSDIHKAAEFVMRDYPNQVQALIKRWLKDKNEYGKV